MGIGKGQLLSFCKRWLLRLIVSIVGLWLAGIVLFAFAGPFFSSDGGAAGRRLA